MIPTPTEITYFFEVYHTKNISKAALRLGVSQPALTQSIHKLEEKLKTRLWIRTKQGVIATRGATVFYARAKQLLESWKQIEQDVHTSDIELFGTFRVGCHQSVGGYVAPPLMRNLSKQAPGIEIQFVHDFSRKITEKVVSFEVDIGYVVNPPRHPDLVFRKIGDDRVTFWKKRGIVSLPKKIFADDSRKQIEELLGRTFPKHFRDWSVVGTTSLELIRNLTAQGLGVGILPERVAHAENKELEIYDAKLPSRADQIYLIYRKEVLASKVGKAFLQLASISI